MMWQIIFILGFAVGWFGKEWGMALFELAREKFVQTIKKKHP